MSYWKNINIKKILDQVPDYKEFLTIDELDNSSKKLAEEFDSVEIFEIGKSREGSAINCLKIGEGKKNILFFGFPHPNEPIGSLTVEFMVRYLAENPEFTKNTGYTWYLIKAMDIDGAKLNEGWFKGEFDPYKFAKNYYRPPFHEQVEWSFPIEYKKLKFTEPTLETQALMKLMSDIKPIFNYSLHNAGFCGVYFYISEDIKPMCDEFVKLVEDEELPLHKGEPETAFNVKLYPGIFKGLGIREAYDFYEEQGFIISDLIKIGAGSHDHLQKVVGSNVFTLICEMPYIYHEDVENTEKTNLNRRDVVIESINTQKELFAKVKPIFRKLKKYSDKSSRIYTTLEMLFKTFDMQISVELHNAQTNPMYEGKATVAQVLDSKYSSPFYTFCRYSQLVRLCEEALERHPDKKDITEMKEDLEQWIHSKMQELLIQIELTTIPIQKLVRVQVGSALIALKHLSN